MIIHLWLHWFWITTLTYKGLFLSSRHVVEAGLLDATFSPSGGGDVALSDGGQSRRVNASQTDEEEERARRNVEDEEVELESTTTTVASGEDVTNNTEALGGETADGAAYHGSMSSDVDDTYGAADGFHYPLKKYSKSKYGKLKGKDKDGRPESSDAANGTAPENATEEGANGTAPERNETGVALEGGEQPPANATEEQASAETVANETSLMAENKLEETVRTTVEPFIFNNRVAAATSSESRERLGQPGLDAGSITGITFGIVVLSGFIGALSFVMYRRRYLNKPQALNDKCSNLDSSGYIDDTSLRENSEEMYSLDNDSFLNSLEAMTIQNYWTENVKHTKL